MPAITRTEVSIPAGQVTVNGLLAASPDVRGIVVFAHGSGSSRFSPRNQQVAGELQVEGFGTLLFDLLTAEEAAIDEGTREYRFDIALLGERLIAATDWLRQQDATRDAAIGYFGASTGAAAALVAAAARRDGVKAIVSRGGRPDLAGEALHEVKAPTLLIVGGLDTPVIGMNQDAQRHLHAHNELVIVEGATHLFEEPGTMEQVTKYATAWFRDYLNA